MDKTFGIDISKWQSGMDLAAAKREGVQFVILRGADHLAKDTQFDEFYARCQSLQLPVGCYQYCRAITPAEAQSEARYLIENVLKGKKFAYPIYGDFEEESQKKLGKAKMDEVIKAYCTALEQAGYFAGVYCSEDFYKTACSGAELAKKYTWWLAKWTSKEITAFPMWQFGGEQNFIRSNKIAGKVCDQNYCRSDFPAIIKRLRKNGFSDADELRDAVQKRFGLSDATMAYLTAYRYADDLLKKLVQ